MRHAMVLYTVLIVLTIGIFMQVGGHEFINFDDPLYVTNNPQVKGGLTAKNIVWAFSTTHASNWHPLTWLSHMADVQLYGLNPRGHHLTNVTMHVLSTLLLFLFLAQVTTAPWQSLFVAALFALHPLHVESVAWVAERKDVLSCLFWMLTLLLYARYVKNPGRKRYLLVLLCFAAGLMSKPMLVTLPLVMILMDYWPLNRFQSGSLPQDAHGFLSSYSPLPGLLKEKLPFFALSVLSALVTVYAQKAGGAMKSTDVIPLVIRAENALVAYARYIEKTLWPHDLALLYPFPSSMPLWQVLASCVLLVIVSLVVIRLRGRHPYLIVGWLWFLVTLVPVIGLVQVGGQSMADRYTYIPLIGLFIMAGWAVPDLLRDLRHHSAILAILSCAAILTLSVATWGQLGYWKDNISLYRHTLDVTTNNYLILNNYGIALADRGEVDAAIQAYNDALRIWPKSATVHVNLGAALANQGRFQEAIAHYNEALRLIPDYALAWSNLSKTLSNMGVALAQEGRPDEAIRHFRQSVSIDPQNVDGHFNLGVALARMNRVDEAAEQFTEVLNLMPDSTEARAWLIRLGR